MSPLDSKRESGNWPTIRNIGGITKLIALFFFVFCWLDPLCTGPWAVLDHSSGEAGIRGMPCRFYVLHVQSD